MKKRIIFPAIFAIMLFAVMANAQHTRVIVGDDQGVWGTAASASSRNSSAAVIYRNVNGNWVQLSGDAAVGPAIRAGQTIRLRIAATNNRGLLIVGVDNVKLSSASPNGRLYLATNVGVYQVPCEGAATRSGGVSTAQLTLTGSISDMSSSWKTDKDWRGTCRMLVMKQSDGNEVRGKIRFE